MGLGLKVMAVSSTCWFSRIPCYPLIRSPTHKVSATARLPLISASAGHYRDHSGLRPAPSEPNLKPFTGQFTAAHLTEGRRALSDPSLWPILLPAPREPGPPRFAATLLEFRLRPYAIAGVLR